MTTGKDPIGLCECGHSAVSHDLSRDMECLACDCSGFFVSAAPPELEREWPRSEQEPEEAAPPEPSQDEIARRAHETISARQAHRGDPGASFQEVGAIVELLRRPHHSPGEVAALTLQAVKLVRWSYDPDDVDHYVDGAGYWEIMWRARQALDEAAPRLHGLNVLSNLAVRVARLEKEVRRGDGV